MASFPNNMSKVLAGCTFSSSPCKCGAKNGSLLGHALVAQSLDAAGEGTHGSCCVLQVEKFRGTPHSYINVFFLKKLTHLELSPAL